MATLHFDTDQGRTTRSQIQTAQGDISQNLQTLRTNVSSLIGSAWIAPAADQFNEQFEQWAGQLQPLLDQLEDLGQRLDTEITQWEDTAQNLG